MNESSRWSCRRVALVEVGVPGSSCWRSAIAPSRRSGLRRLGADANMFFSCITYLCRSLAERRSAVCPLRDPSTPVVGCDPVVGCEIIVLGLRGRPRSEIRQL